MTEVKAKTKTHRALLAAGLVALVLGVALWMSAEGGGKGVALELPVASASRAEAPAKLHDPVPVRETVEVPGTMEQTASGEPTASVAQDSDPPALFTLFGRVEVADGLQPDSFGVRVMESESGTQPLHLEAVEIDGEGEYSLQIPLFSGRSEVRLHFEFELAEHSAADFWVFQAGGGDRVRHDVLFLQAGERWGLVLGPRGAAIEGAWVTPSYEEQGAVLVPGRRVRTGADGVFVIEASAVRHLATVVARAPGLAPGSPSEWPSSPLEGIVIQLSEGATIEGNVAGYAGLLADAEGTGDADSVPPIVRAELGAIGGEVVDPWGAAQWWAEVQPDPTGHYRISAVPRGLISLQVRGDSREILSPIVTLVSSGEGPLVADLDTVNPVRLRVVGTASRFYRPETSFAVALLGPAAPSDVETVLGAAGGTLAEPAVLLLSPSLAARSDLVLAVGMSRDTSIRLDLDPGALASGEVQVNIEPKREGD